MPTLRTPPPPRPARAPRVPSQASQPPLDYYRVLEVPRTANKSDIRRAYRALALRWHPDKNPGDFVEATRRFKEISEAYDVLSDVEKKRVYDQRTARAPRPRPRAPPREHGSAAVSPSPLWEFLRQTAEFHDILLQAMSCSIYQSLVAERALRRDATLGISRPAMGRGRVPRTPASTTPPTPPTPPTTQRQPLARNYLLFRKSLKMNHNV